jgi:hypothetical protein
MKIEAVRPSRRPSLGAQAQRLELDQRIDLHLRDPAQEPAHRARLAHHELERAPQHVRHRVIHARA